LVNATGTGAIASMTGFAAREGAAEGVAWSWELRGVNGRGLDLRLRLPDGLGALEAPLRKLLGARLARGNVTLGLRLTRAGGAADGPLDDRAIELGIQRLQQVRHAAERHFVTLHPPTSAEVISLMPQDNNAQADLPPVEAFLADAEPLIDGFCQMRAQEGAAIAGVLSGLIDRMADLTDAAEKAAAARAEPQSARLRASLQAVLEATDGLDEARIAQELAVIAAKTDVTEEIDRLRAHIAAARDLLARGGPVGRKLDFLMQEFNREANTLCSKSQDAALTAIGLDLKLAIDQTREQVQNVE